jgi:hypothetical protein
VPRRWVAPREGVRVEGDDLVIDAERYFEVYSRPDVNRVRSSRGLLERFVSLRDTGPKGIARFANSWGLLDPCSHGLWSFHGPIQLPGSLADTRTAPLLTPCETLATREPVVLWRYWAEQAHALLQAIGRLLEGRPCRPEDWAILDREGPWVRGVSSMTPPRSAGAGMPSDVRVQKVTVAQAATTWMHAGGVRLVVGWFDGSGAAVDIGSHSLLGGIGMQLALAATRLHSLWVCSACGSPYTSSRPPRYEQRNFCSSCREEGLPSRFAERDYRDRKRAARSGSRRGSARGTRGTKVE